MDNSHRWYSSIYEISKAINAKLEVRQILRVIARETLRHAGYHRLLVGLLDRTGEWLHPHMAGRDGVLRPAGRIGLDGRALGFVIHNREPLVIADLSSDCRFPNSALGAEGVRSCVVLPLESSGEILGALAVGRSTPDAFSESETAMLLEIAEQTATAVRHAQLIDQLREEKQKLAEAKDSLVHSDRLATVGRLAAHVAHEIRNPLATIGGFTHGILKSPTDAARVARNARIILEEVERLEQILANVMNFSRPGEPLLRTRCANETVEAVCAFHENAFAERSVVVHKALDPSCPEQQYDPDQIRQVLLNLIQNALDAMPNGGELTVETQNRGDHVRIVVSDTGEGMSREVIDTLFQPFYTTKVGGTGLGLSVSQKIIRDHGGRIAVVSEPGRGSSFTVSLPVDTDT